MKPQTKLHHEVIKLSAKLPKITNKHKEWAWKKVFTRWAYKTKHTTVCFECGHAWNVETNLISSLLGCDCPKCKNKLKVTDSKAWSKQEWGYFQIMTTFHGFQIVRMFFLMQYYKKGYKASYSCIEVYQHWIAPDGRFTVLAIKKNSMGGWRSGQTAWCYDTPMEVRRNDNDTYFINKIPTFPGRKILPIIRRNGFKGNFHEFNQSWFFHIILAYPIAETLLKTGQISLLKAFEPKDKLWTKYWQQIKICIRNGYIIRDTSMWLDHLELLEYFHKDTHNPKFICPANLNKEHQKLIDRRQKIRNKEELARIEAELEKANIEYQKLKGKFIGLAFADGEIKIVVPRHVKEIYMEGKALHHCVYSNDYHKKPDTLILSARKNNKFLETIEVSLVSMKLIQARGACNKDSKYHRKIVKLAQSCIPAIEKASKSRKRVKEVA
jgi:hypothetical protein